MSIESNIKSIVEDMGINYLFEDWSRANFELDKSLRSEDFNFPVCINLLPVSGMLSQANGYIKDASNCLVVFADKADFDFKGATNQVAVERMKTLAMIFISKCNESGKFEPITDSVRYSVLYDTLDVNITGVTVELTLKEATGRCAENLI